MYVSDYVARVFCWALGHWWKIRTKADGNIISAYRECRKCYQTMPLKEWVPRANRKV